MWKRILCTGVLAMTNPAQPADASGGAAASGVSGVVNVSPSCGGPQRVDQDCSAPLPATGVQLFNASGSLAHSAVTGADGRFTIHAAAGDYELRVAVQGRFPRCRATAITIHEGQMARVEISCDSGMR